MSGGQEREAFAYVLDSPDVAEQHHDAQRARSRTDALAAEFGDHSLTL